MFALELRLVVVVRLRFIAPGWTLDAGFPEERSPEATDDIPQAFRVYLLPLGRRPRWGVEDRGALA